MSKPRKVKEWLTEEGLAKLEGWARNGLTEEQIASNCGVTRLSLYNWRKKYPEIQNALRKGKEVIDLQVENALLKAAMGYDYVEEYVDSNGVKRANKKHMPPNVLALIFWLKNRKPEQWRDRRDDNVIDVTPVVIKDDVKVDD